MNYVLAICDSEIDYACRFVHYLENKKGFPFQVQLFTSKETLIAHTKKQPVFMTLISEREYSSELEEAKIEHIFLLGEESGETERIKKFNKYQSLTSLTKELLDWIVEKQIVTRVTRAGYGLKMIGVYSPVGKCLKTSFSFLLGQCLGKKNKVLYLNMETYSGLGKLLEREFTTDLSELIYYLQHSKESFGYKLGGMIEQVGDLDVLPPFGSYLDFVCVTQEEWIRLMKEIEQNSEYEYLILDLSDAVQGLFDLLRLCDTVYTLSREDGFAKAKISQYEEVLRKSNYEDIWKKTRHYRVPKIKNLPDGLLRLTYTELADFVKERVEEDF